jgi:hypothetical protein
MGRLFDRRRGLSFLWRRIVWDSFQEEGVMPEIQRMIKKSRRASL